jgi:phage tail-like protein
MAAFATGRADPLRGMKYQVTIPDFPQLKTMGFSKISGISQESEVIEYREGDQSLAAMKLPGLIKTGDVTLERGVAHVSSMEALVAWKEAASTAMSGEIDGNDVFRHNVYVAVLNRLGQPEWEIILVNAWPRMIEYGDLDANASDIWIATFTLAYEALTPPGVSASVEEMFSGF